MSNKKVFLAVSCSGGLKWLKRQEFPKANLRKERGEDFFCWAVKVMFSYIKIFSLYKALPSPFCTNDEIIGKQISAASLIHELLKLAEKPMNICR